MGDGLHHEDPWIAKEYTKVLKALHPEIWQEKRKAKADRTDTKMQELLLTFRCKCGGILKQKRSGTKVCYCTQCDARYVATHKKKTV